MHQPCDLQPVLAQYSPEYYSGPIQQLGWAGGFSGAQFWRLTAKRGRFCLRCWPQQHPSRERLQLIHAALLHVQQQGFSAVAAPIKTLSGATFVEHQGHLWELSCWLEGEANYHQQPTPAKLQAAMQALAQFHLAIDSFPTEPASVGFPSALADRLRQIQELLRGGFSEISAAIVPGDWPQLASRATHILTCAKACAPLLVSKLEAAQSLQLPMQLCLRDVWHDHILFSGELVSGMVDFGAMRQESVVGDIARLLGSLVGDDLPARELGIKAYQEIRPLSPSEIEALPAYDQSAVLLSGISWFSWIYLENRRFEQRETIIQRLDENLARLQFLSQAAS